MVSRVNKALAGYPRQFWVLFFGQLISASGSSLVWPFMTIYVYERLDVPLTTVGLVLAANSAAGLVSQIVAGPVIDRFGRKLALVLSLGSTAVIMTFLGFASSLPAFLILLALFGLFGALFSPSVNSMVADIVESDRRIGAYGLLRIALNLGVSIGPAIGGYIATRSYLISFLAAASASAVYFLISLVFVRETKPEVEAGDSGGADGGYGYLVRDYHFVLFCVATMMGGIAYAQMATIFPVYMKDGFGIAENQFGLIWATNAVMVVLFQLPVTRVVERFPLGPVLASGALFYALGVGSVGLFSSFWGFLLSMVILTIGELILAPASTTFVANVAPEAMRGRYMSVFGLSFGICFGVGPVVGGAINDHLGPSYVWQAMFVAGLVAALLYLWLGRSGAGQKRVSAPVESIAEAGIAMKCVPSCGEAVGAIHDCREVENR